MSDVFVNAAITNVMYLSFVDSIEICLLVYFVVQADDVRALLSAASPNTASITSVTSNEAGTLATTAGLSPAGAALLSGGVNADGCSLEKLVASKEGDPLTFD